MVCAVPGDGPKVNMLRRRGWTCVHHSCLIFDTLGGYGNAYSPEWSTRPLCRLCRALAAILTLGLVIDDIDLTGPA